MSTETRVHYTTQPIYPNKLEQQVPIGTSKSSGFLSNIEKDNVTYREKNPGNSPVCCLSVCPTSDSTAGCLKLSSHARHGIISGSRVEKSQSTRVFFSLSSSIVRGLMPCLSSATRTHPQASSESAGLCAAPAQKRSLGID
jgi:hypothetical protein